MARPAETGAVRVAIVPYAIPKRFLVTQK
jgi:hypothetical protein